MYSLEIIYFMFIVLFIIIINILAVNYSLNRLENMLIKIKNISIY